MTLVPGEVYSFNEIYSNCGFAEHDAECRCNNGYQCNHEDCDEECEHGVGKCYSFTCPLVTENPSREDIEASEDWDIEGLEFEGFTVDTHELDDVVYNGEGETT